MWPTAEGPGADAIAVSDSLAIAASLAREFAATAAARDKTGGTPKRERDALRASGLLKLVVPTAFGGAGRPWTEALRVVRTIAEADGSLGHVLGYHYLVSSAPRLLGSEAQWQRWVDQQPLEIWRGRIRHRLLAAGKRALGNQRYEKLRQGVLGSGA